MKKRILVPVIMTIVSSLLLTGFVSNGAAVYADNGSRKTAAVIEKSDCLEAMANKEPPMSWNNSTDLKPQSFMPSNPNLFYRKKKKKTDISNPVDARNGVVRILSMDDETNPSSFSTGSGFGVGIIGEETAVFLTNRHVVMNTATGEIFSHIYIMLDDNALKQTYTSFGDFINEELGKPFNWK